MERIHPGGDPVSASSKIWRARLQSDKHRRIVKRTKESGVRMQKHQNINHIMSIHGLDGLKARIPPGRGKNP